MRQRREKIVLTEEQEKFFIKTWESNDNLSASAILYENLGLERQDCYVYSKELRAKGLLRDKNIEKFPQELIDQFQLDYESGYTLKEISARHHRFVDTIRKHLLKRYGTKRLPKIQPILNGEEWRDVEGATNYQVSNLGRVYNKKTGLMIKGGKGERYVRLALIMDNGEKTHIALHRLVAHIFVPNPDNKPEVDHIDSNPLNNRASNLRWVLKEEQLENEATIQKRTEAMKKAGKNKSIKPILQKLFAIQPDKMELIKMIIDYKD